MIKKIIHLVILICLLPHLTIAQNPKTEILILGTSHLHQIKGFEPSMLNNVIAKLNSMNFDVVCVEKMPGQGIETHDFSALYSFINSKEYMKQDYNGQWKIWLKTNFASGSDRASYSLWEMRNLQIAANILNVVSLHPDKKIIVIIGSSHKGFLEKYLK